MPPIVASDTARKLDMVKILSHKALFNLTITRPCLDLPLQGMIYTWFLKPQFRLYIILDLGSALKFTNLIRFGLDVAQ